MKIKMLLSSLLFLQQIVAQSILPPIMEWKGKSESLIANAANPWITPTEKAGFVTTPNYNETITWLKKLAAASPIISIVSIGKSAEGRDIVMLIASTEKIITAAALKKSAKPLLLVQAGIHSGEIDGKDAGMMLLRDIAFGNKRYLLDKVNLLFIPILNVDGHERRSSYNRPNQRGPQNMGWRTNAQNLNLNRDYAKIDTKEIRAVIKVMNEYDPLLYMDIHVTDGADYQYDITFGGHGKQGYSSGISNWLANTYKPIADRDLTAQGHIPGSLLTTVNDRDFSDGNILILGEPRFSDAYGDLRHMASILVENHSLKPFRQRVLGTYVLLQSTLAILATKGSALKEITIADRKKRATEIPMKWKVPQMEKSVSFEPQSNLLQKNKSALPTDSFSLSGIQSIIKKSAITNADYIEWTGKPITMMIANYRGTDPVTFIKRPKAYYVPASSYEIIERLKMHGIQMELLQQLREVPVEMYRVQTVKIGNEGGEIVPFEGHVQVNAYTKVELHNQLYATGSARISTDQPLGDLAMLLLEPDSPDSYFQWGFFLSIFQRTEYIEGYVMEPTIQKMLAESPELTKEFELKKTTDTAFANNPTAAYNWFYSKSNYYDKSYLLYPVGREL